MPNDLDPIVGNWYKRVDKGQAFVVVAIDEHEGTIELQRFDGDIDEVDFQSWRNMELELGDAPEDWSGPVDNIEHDDIGYGDTETTSAAEREALEEIPSSAEEEWEDATPEDERDEWGEGVSAEESWPQDRIENSKLAGLRGVEIGEGEEEPESDS